MLSIIIINQSSTCHNLTAAVPHLSINSQPSKTRLTRRRLRAALQVRVRVADRPGDGVEGKACRLGRELHFGADVEESEIAVHQVVGDTCCFVLEISRQQDAPRRQTNSKQ